MENSPRRNYDPAFKLEVLKMVEQGNKTVVEIASDLGLYPELIYRWRKSAAQNPQSAFPGKGHLNPQDQELRRLRKELFDTREERDILKKALAVFSRAPK
jgi:transposase